MKIDFKQVVKDNQENSPGGIDAIFVPINDKWALKMFKDEHVRDRSYNIQKELSKHKLAPRVGKKIDITDGEFCYGFICEIVETVISHDMVAKIKYYSDNGLNWTKEMEKEWDNKEEEIDKERSLLLEKYRDMGFCPCDIHPGNFGYLIVNGERRLVCIDFGAW